MECLIGLALQLPRQCWKISVWCHQLNQQEAIDRYKLRRERRHVRDSSLHMISQPCDQIKTLYFDGRKGKTLIEEGSRWFRRTVNEEHITVLCEHGGKFRTHLSPDSSSAKGIKDCICRYHAENNVDMSNIVGIGYDGTATNTSSTGGVTRLLEQELGKPLQWLPCQLHANELPLRHLMKHFDGSTTGPHGFLGFIGSALSKCELLPVCNFDQFPMRFNS